MLSIDRNPNPTKNRMCMWQLYWFVKRIHVLEARIWSPFLLLIGMVYLQIGSGIEIANHFYEGNFELDEFKSDLVNGTFYYFNFGAQALMVLGLRQAGVPFFRSCSAGSGEQSKWQCFAAWVGTVFDVFMVLSIPATPVVYALGGRDKAVSICSAFGGE